MLKRIAVKLIELYQKTLSPDHGMLKILFPFGACRYQPTCSEYSKQAIIKYGIWRGMFIAIKRIIRCHPKAVGGYDPLK